jgi:hypothetical protein
MAEVDDRFSDDMFPPLARVQKHAPRNQSSEDFIRPQLDSVSSDLSKYACMEPDCV